MAKKIPISEYISDKKLDKIMRIIESSESVEESYDRLEDLLSDDFKIKDLGTNRLIFVSKKDKHKDVIFKVAGDKHGIEANRREFFNGDIDKRLTFSYSISKNGVFVVQEKVKPLDSEKAKELRSEIRDMLKKLGRKILLVDCKVSNFKNFGIRKNGEVCLLDHGDTVPLPEYQSGNVNDEEEAYVSLRCKEIKNPQEITDPSKLKPCGGKLKYSKNFDYLECEKCGSRIPVNDAYKIFYGDEIQSGGARTLDLGENFYTWRDSLESYCDKQMGYDEDETMTVKMEEKSTMKTKMFNNENHVNIKGYWIPEKYTIGAYALKIVSVKNGKISPADYLKSLGYDAKTMVVKIEDHNTSVFVDKIEDIQNIARKLLKRAKNIAVKYKERNVKVKTADIDFGVVSNSDENVMKRICKELLATKEISRTRYSPERELFMIELTEDVFDDLIGPNEIIAVEDVSDEKDDESRKKYLVEYHIDGRKTNICCYKHNKYYVPVKLYSGTDILSNSEAKELLDDEGYMKEFFNVERASATEISEDIITTDIITTKTTSSDSYSKNYKVDFRKFVADNDDEKDDDYEIDTNDESYDEEDEEEIEDNKSISFSMTETVTRYIEENNKAFKEIVDEIENSGNKSVIINTLHSYIIKNMNDNCEAVVPVSIFADILESKNVYIENDRYKTGSIAASVVSHIMKDKWSGRRFEVSNSGFKSSEFIVSDMDFFRYKEKYDKFNSLINMSSDQFCNSANTILPEIFDMYRDSEEFKFANYYMVYIKYVIDLVSSNDGNSSFVETMIDSILNQSWEVMTNIHKKIVLKYPLSESPRQFRDTYIVKSNAGEDFEHFYFHEKFETIQDYMYDFNAAYFDDESVDVPVEFMEELIRDCEEIQYDKLLTEVFRPKSNSDIEVEAVELDNSEDNIEIVAIKGNNKIDHGIENTIKQYNAIMDTVVNAIKELEIIKDNCEKQISALSELVSAE